MWMEDRILQARRGLSVDSCAVLMTVELSRGCQHQQLTLPQIGQGQRTEGETKKSVACRQIQDWTKR